jgi:hypothetical protein
VTEVATTRPVTTIRGMRSVWFIDGSGPGALGRA